MKQLNKCCGKIMRCYQSEWRNNETWTGRLFHRMQCMECGKMVEIKDEELQK